MKRAFPGLLLLCAGCAVGSPWTEGLAPLPTSGDVVIGLTHFRIKDASSDDLVLKHVDKLEALLATSPGNIGYSLRRESFGRGDYWTMSAWTSEAAMGEFVGSQEHTDAMIQIMPLSESSRTMTFYVPASEVPPNWDDALHALERNGIDRHAKTDDRYPTRNGADAYGADWAGVELFLEERCHNCHASTGAPSNLQFPDAILADVQSGNGAWVKPGDADGSTLWVVINSGYMPKGPRLEDSQRAGIRDWINAGAPIP